MNKINTKNSKVDIDKCPSTLAVDKVKDVSNKCILNEKTPELKNGLVNGLVNVNNSSGGKKSSRKKKNKNTKHETVNSSETEQNHSVEKEDQSNVENDISRNSKEDVNNVDRKHGSKATLDSNENISCDKTSSHLKLVSLVSECVSKDAQVSSDVISELDSFNKLSLEDKDRENSVEGNVQKPKPKIEFIQYESELQMPMIMKIIQKDLSEPYSIYTYRYFIHNWPKLCFLAMCEGECVGAIVCKLDLHRKVIKRGYIAMLAVDQDYRKLRIGSNLVQMAINEMLLGDADEVVLETEVTNNPALQLYEKLGFVRDKRLFRYYLNGVDALRLKLWLR
ncbi:unnamed protein product [Psylliodes chrysocephalus]|uniref:N-terminal methionine N(alpha)-acetyltransferase NatC n=1 Tax=Psylliodes chrysocephalus TaxID=3402493 RepID=A0A9P0CUE1_9CUCU|nr:unnamed protein product [Psylliodes chrysocephala]